MGGECSGMISIWFICKAEWKQERMKEKDEFTLSGMLITKQVVSFRLGLQAFGSD